MANATGSTRPVSGAAIGWTYFAAMMMILIGVFHAIVGLTAIIDDEFLLPPATTSSSSTRPSGDGSTSSSASSSPSRVVTC